jgi:hypothetical protein
MGRHWWASSHKEAHRAGLFINKKPEKEQKEKKERFGHMNSLL